MAMKQILNLAAFIDGTWNDYASGTNVRRLYDSVVQRTRYVLDDDEVSYLTYANYERGPGTAPDVQYTGGGFATDLARAIGDSYDWLATRFRNRDAAADVRLFLFGFSRGAYSVHVLSWILSEIGLPYNVDYAKDIVSAYVDKDADRLAKAVRRGDCRPTPRIEMLGVWDVVSAPLDVKSDYHDGETAPAVNWLCHAMAANEHRLNFDVMHFRTSPRMGLKQLWFAGVHGDVGGMYDDDRSLSNITLAWMGCRARERGLGLSPRPVEPSSCDFTGLKAVHDEAPFPDTVNRTFREGDVFHASVAELKNAYPTYEVALENVPTDPPVTLA